MTEEGDIYRLREGNVFTNNSRHLPVTLGARSAQPGGGREWILRTGQNKKFKTFYLRTVCLIQYIKPNYTSIRGHVV